MCKYLTSHEVCLPPWFYRLDNKVVPKWHSDYTHALHMKFGVVFSLYVGWQHAVKCNIFNF